MPIDDEQLDDMLRELSVPPDLKARLLEIPDGDAKTDAMSNVSRLRTAMVGTILALAASVFVFVYIAPSQVASVDPNVNDAEIASLLLADMERNQAAIEEILEAQSFLNSSGAPLSTEPIYESKEAAAMALSMSWQSSIDQGASFESVKAELENVVATYPNTRGAKQARDLLQIN